MSPVGSNGKYTMVKKRFLRFEELRIFKEEQIPLFQVNIFLTPTPLLFQQIIHFPIYESMYQYSGNK